MSMPSDRAAAARRAFVRCADTKYSKSARGRMAKAFATRSSQNPRRHPIPSPQPAGRCPAAALLARWVLLCVLMACIVPAAAGSTRSLCAVAAAHGPWRRGPIAPSSSAAAGRPRPRPSCLARWSPVLVRTTHQPNPTATQAPAQPNPTQHGRLIARIPRTADRLARLLQLMGGSHCQLADVVASWWHASRVEVRAPRVRRERLEPPAFRLCAHPKADGWNPSGGRTRAPRPADEAPTSWRQDPRLDGRTQHGATTGGFRRPSRRRFRPGIVSCWLVRNVLTPPDGRPAARRVRSRSSRALGTTAAHAREEKPSGEPANPTTALRAAHPLTPTL
jgi:hypothetical protein